MRYMCHHNVISAGLHTERSALRGNRLSTNACPSRLTKNECHFSVVARRNVSPEFLFHELRLGWPASIDAAMGAGFRVGGLRTAEHSWAPLQKCSRRVTKRSALRQKAGGRSFGTQQLRSWKTLISSQQIFPCRICPSSLLRGIKPAQPGPYNRTQFRH
jgi:hypothetical protein